VIGPTLPSRGEVSILGEPAVRFVLSLYYRLDHLVRELMKFGVVGVFAYVVDVGSFNFLRFADGDGPLHDKPLTAKTISVVLATTVAYLGHRHWTFRRRDRSGVAREYPLFVMLNGVGLVIALTCLAISHYLLGFTSPLADNIAANIVGMALGTAFRFWSYRRWVFRETVEDAGETTWESRSVSVTRFTG
jgi:putative flippase GtrA